MVGGGDVTVDDARVEGLGAPLTATVRKTPATMTVRAATQGLDLARVARLAHLENILQGGTLALDTDVHLRRTAAEGRLRLDAKHVGAAKARDVSAHVELSLEGRKVTGKVHGEVPGAATLDVDASGVGLGGAGALTSATWKQAFGSVDVNAHADLAKLAGIVPLEDLPVGEAHGDVVVHVHAGRDGVDDSTPAIKLTLTTRQLALAPRTRVERDIGGAVVQSTHPWRIAGIDLAVDGDIDGDTGALRMSNRRP